jgi:hypothetical protein
VELTKQEQKALRQNELAVFEDRIILDARPAVSAATLKKIAKRCSGPIPDSLIELWRTSFGGTLDYDLRVAFAGHEARASFSELFYPESDGYHDLWGWIEHELEIGELERLDYLPFGGFEYLVRFYVQVKPGPEHGAVFVWMKGLPPAWRLRLHEDSVARVADDVRSLFRQLCLETDPTVAGDRYVAGSDLSERIEELARSGKSGQSAAEKLNQLVAKVVLDFRAALDDGSIGSDMRLARLALEAAARNDDVELVARLAELECDLGQLLGGGGTAVDHALACGSLNVARELLGRGLSAPNGIKNGAPFCSVDLVKELLSHGAEPDFDAVLTAASYDHLDGAIEIARALLASDPGVLDELLAAAQERADDEEARAKRVESGEMGSNKTPAEMRARAERYRALGSRLA